MDYRKVGEWNEQDLQGEFAICLKIDGIRMLRDENNNPVSCAGKPLYNLDGVPLAIRDAEIFVGNSWDTTVSAVRTKDAEPVPLKCVFSLFPMDERLFICRMQNPRAEELRRLLANVVEKGFEGLVLHEIGGKKRLLKVKPVKTYDVKVLDMSEGKGKCAGAMGALMTPMGKVGTGFSAETRDLMFKYPETVIGKIIEVKCMELTKNGKFRHARFVRLREDK